MKWKYEYRGTHVHIRVYVNNALSGTLCMTIDEFEFWKAELTGHIQFVLIRP